MKRGMLVGLAVLSLGGCVTANPPLYEWGTYQRDLLSYSKNPGETKKFSAALLANIQTAEAAHKVPPGMYAESVYTLLDAGDGAGAVTYFAKERQAWPESAALMDKIIAKLSKRAANDAANAGAQSKDGGAGK